MIWRMGKAADRRTLDEIITDNAHLLLKRRIVARRIERQPYYLNTLAAEMVPFMWSAEERASEGFAMSAAIDRIVHTLPRYLGIAKSPKLAWRVDYLEGFFLAMGVPLSAMTDPDGAPDEVERSLLERMMEGAEWRVPPPKRAERKGAPPPDKL